MARSFENIGSGRVLIDLQRSPEFGADFRRIATTYEEKYFSKFVFYHIPRTCGSVFLRAMEEWHSPSSLLDTFPIDEGRALEAVRELSATALDPAETCVHLHVPYPLHRYMAGQWKYLSFFRDPIQQIVSQFRIVSEATRAGRRSFLGVATNSMLQYLIEHPDYTTDIQARYVLALSSDGSDREGGCQLDRGMPVDEAVEVCLRTIEERFCFTGISELWSASLIAFAYTTNRSDVPLMYDFMNSTFEYEPTSTEIDLALERTIVDRSLYKAIRSKFVEEHHPLIEVLRKYKIPPLHKKNGADEKLRSCLLETR